MLINHDNMTEYLILILLICTIVFSEMDRTEKKELKIILQLSVKEQTNEFIYVFFSN